MEKEGKVDRLEVENRKGDKKEDKEPGGKKTRGGRDLREAGKNREKIRKVVEE